jgi:hypothetical protein
MDTLIIIIIEESFVFQPLNIQYTHTVKFLSNQPLMSSILG